jgi:uncharacterized protein YcfL
MKKLFILFFISILMFTCKKDTAIKKQIPIEVKNLQTKKTIQTIENDSVEVDETNIQKATISLKDSLIWIKANMRLDHRIFGYEKPNLVSKKMLLISIFTTDVEKNPFNCEYGAYYESDEMQDIKLKFKENIGEFSKIELIKENESKIIYFENKWLEFEE